jgi:hypothetical protein
MKFYYFEFFEDNEPRCGYVTIDPFENVLWTRQGGFTRDFNALLEFENYIKSVYDAKDFVLVELE